MLIWDLSYVDNAIHATALIRQLLGQEGKADFVTKTSENIKKSLHNELNINFYETRFAKILKLAQAIISVPNCFHSLLHKSFYTK